MNDYDVGGLGPFGFSVDYDPLYVDAIVVVMSQMDHELERFELPKGTEPEKIYDAIQKWAAHRLGRWLEQVNNRNFEFYAGGPE